MSVDSLFNVFVLLMLIFFIMAVLGNTMFSMVTEGNVISEFKNFTNFHQSFSLLFSISTGEDWNRVMYDCMRTTDCIPGKTCGSSIGAVFFLSFNVIVSNIMLNLFILVIIQQFDKYFLTSDSPLMRFEDDFADFKNSWKDLTERYQCTKLKTNKLQDFIDKLPQHMKRKLGVEDAKSEDFDRIILKMGINVDDGFIYFNEMLYRIMRAQYVTARKLKFNKVMTVSELVTQFKIAEIILKEKRLGGKISRAAREQAFFDQHQAMPVNLFLTKMFFKTSFIAWRNQMRKEVQYQRWEKEQKAEKEFCESIGREYVKPKYPEENAANISIDLEYDG